MHAQHPGRSGTSPERPAEQTRLPAAPCRSARTDTGAQLAARFSSTVIVAPKPPSVIPGGAAGPGLLAQVVVSKYGDHLPLYRLERIFARQGVHFARQTLCDWCAGCATALTPLWELIREEVLALLRDSHRRHSGESGDAHAKARIPGAVLDVLRRRTAPADVVRVHSTRGSAPGPDRVRMANYRGLSASRRLRRVRRLRGHRDQR